MLFGLWVFPEVIVFVLAHNYVPSSVMRIVMESAYVTMFNMQYS